MSKERKEFDLEERLIYFAVHVIRRAESLPKSNKKKTSQFDIPCSIFDIKLAY